MGAGLRGRGAGDVLRAAHQRQAHGGWRPACARRWPKWDRNKPVANLRTVEEYLDGQVQYVRLYVLLLGIFGAIAAVLAAIGIYGVMAYSVAEANTRNRNPHVPWRRAAGDVFKLVVLHAAVSFFHRPGSGNWRALFSAYPISQNPRCTRLRPQIHPRSSRFPYCWRWVALFACLIPTRRAVTVNPTEKRCDTNKDPCDRTPLWTSKLFVRLPARRGHQEACQPLVNSEAFRK